MREKPKAVRCAIYTRKSSEEGLEQEFNSLHAQRESGEAYVASQKHEGWEVIKTAYDDGGYSGGNVERPALRKLLADIQDGKVDVVVVYKVDRLSRSLGDFARIVELFDKHKVSFVSVTQQFNTSTSMGRLTLNVLLSFAQFEREVTGERIRDKIDASKKKGMWTGGFPPLGYDVIHKKLVVNPVEVEQVNHIFKRYIELKSVYALVNELNEQGIRSKAWIDRNGEPKGGAIYDKCKVYKIIGNPVYIGKITHWRKKALYDGLHEAIVSKELWDRAEEIRLESKNARGKPKHMRGTLLVGLMEGKDGVPYTPTYTLRPNGNRYSYYMHNSSRHRLTALVIEKLVVQSVHEIPLPIPDSIPEAQANHRWEAICQALPNLTSQIQNQIIHSIVEKVICSKDEITIRLSIEGIKKLLAEYKLSESVFNLPPVRVEQSTSYKKSIRTNELYIDVVMTVCFKKSGLKQYITDNDGELVQPVNKLYSEPLISALAKAHRWKVQIENGEYKNTAEIARAEDIKTGYVSRIYRLNHLSPRIKIAILNGNQPHTFNLQQLRDSFPIKWEEQEKAFGF